MARSAEEYGRQLLSLLPPGRIFPNDPGSTLRSFLDALGSAFADVEARSEELLDELDPRTTVQLLPEWENLLGLPDECSGIAGTLQERRDRVVQKLTDQPQQTVAYFIAVAAQLGYPDVTFEELGPFICGLSRCGDLLSGADTDRFYFLVRVGTARVTYFRAGASRAGEKLGAFEQAADLECVLNRIKPAHTVMIFSYEGI